MPFSRVPGGGGGDEPTPDAPTAARADQHAGQSDGAQGLRGPPERQPSGSGMPQVRHDPGILALARRPYDHDALEKFMQDAQVSQVQLALQVPGDAGDPHEGETPGDGRPVHLLYRRPAAPAPGAR